MRPSLRQYAYGLLAAAGAILPWFFNLDFMKLNGGFPLWSYVTSGFANPAASSFTVDLFVAAVVFLVFLLAESNRIGMPRSWVYVVLTFTVAFACAFPLFLLMRERHLQSRKGRRVHIHE